MSDIEHNEPTLSAAEEMIALRDQIEARLLSNPHYRAFVALNRAITDMLGGELPEPKVNGASHRPVHKLAVRQTTNGEISNLTQADATEVLLTTVLHAPAPTTALVKALGAHGVNVGGAKPDLIYLLSCRKTVVFALSATRTERAGGLKPRHTPVNSMAWLLNKKRRRCFQCRRSIYRRRVGRRKFALLHRSLRLATSGNPAGLRRETRAGRWYMQQA